MVNKYSVRLLFKSIHIPNTKGSFFEESIVLVQAKSEKDALKLIKKHFIPDSYENSEGGVTTVKLIKILDIFEIMEEVADSNINFKEIYSQFLIYEDEEISLEEILKKYNNLYGI